ncbi:unnamed protein product [Acanthoscelides obtectus]|uniref:Uncharacterized protein n=1 Tax=Acanthoscelides obtectus TaxID=200917 RepID=A0A9P0PTY1_ACAOB|nr:unnamed protein product [Acanthoscelides obtectus]CAK1679530.1 hypothetical protein AOBTE_LOCUS32329 [Acanthoscelides obtectus]
MISLFASYRREKAKVKKHLGTGKGSQEIYQSTWFAYEALAFLGDRDNPRKILNSMAVDIDVVSNSVSRNEENDRVKESDMPRESISYSQPPKKKRSYTEPRENNKKI